MQDTFLGADERLYFCIRVQLYAVPSLIPAGKATAQFGNTHIRLVAMSVGVAGRIAKRLYGTLRRGHVGTADAQADYILAFGVHLCHFFQLFREIVFAYACQPVGRLYFR